MSIREVFGATLVVSALGAPALAQETTQPIESNAEFYKSVDWSGAAAVDSFNIFSVEGNIITEASPIMLDEIAGLRRIRTKAEVMNNQIPYLFDSRNSFEKIEDELNNGNTVSLESGNFSIKANTRLDKYSIGYNNGTVGAGVSYVPEIKVNAGPWRLGGNNPYKRDEAVVVGLSASFILNSDMSIGDR